MTKRMIVIISGKALDSPFPFDNIDAFVEAIERRASARGFKIERFVITLDPYLRPLTAIPFLSAGFEVVSADDEDVQATKMVFSAALGDDPVDCVAFCFGMKEYPIRTLQPLTGRTNRTLIFLHGSDVNKRAEAARVFDDFIDLDIELPLKTTSLKTFQEWSQENGLPACAAAFDACVKGLGKPQVFRPVCEAAPLEESSQSVRAPLAPPETPLSPTVSLEEEKQRAFDAIKDRASEWIGAFEKALQERGLKAALTKVLNAVVNENGEFLGIPNFADRFSEFVEEKEKTFRKTLENSPIRYIVEMSTNVKTLYHAQHPDMTLVKSDTENVQTFASLAATRAAIEPPQKKKRAVPAFDLSVNGDVRQEDKLAARADLREKQCAYYSEFEWTDSLSRERDPVYEKLFKEESGRLALKKIAVSKDSVPSSTAYGELSCAFKFIAQATTLIKKTNDHFDLIEPKYVLWVGRLSARALGMLRTLMKEFGVDLEKELVYSSALELFKEFIESRCVKLDPNEKYYGLNDSESVEFSAVMRLESEYVRLKAIVERYIRRSTIEPKLRESVAALDVSGADVRALWNEVAQNVKELRALGDVPADYPLFIELLSGRVQDVPSDVETSDAFFDVVQQVDLARTKSSDLTAALNSGDPHVSSARQLCAGKKVIFVGGVPVAEYKDCIQFDFHCLVVWHSYKHEQYETYFQKWLSDPDVVGVVIYEPWCERAYAAKFADLCAQASKRCVRLERVESIADAARAIDEGFALN